MTSSHAESKSRFTYRILLIVLAISTVSLETFSKPQTTKAADQFDLRIPGNDTVSSIAIVDDEKLTLVDKRGRSFVYVRDAAMDSDDYRAYWSDTAGQFLRWPAANKGSLQIGRRTGRSVSWRASHMQVFPVEGGEAAKSDADSQPAAYAHRIATLDTPDRQEFAAQIDEQGKLQMYRFADTRWRHEPELSGADLGVGSSITLDWDSERRQPLIYSIDEQGRLFTLDHGARRLVHNDQNVRFNRGGQIAISDSAQPLATLVDQTGRLWEVDLRSGDFHSIDARKDAFLPETQLAIASAVSDELFVIDKNGNALSYTRNVSGWSAPSLVGKRFTPGGIVRAMADARGDNLFFASVDSQGIARVLLRRDGKWDSIAAPSHKFTPGGSIAMRRAGQGLSLSGIDPRGDWYAFGHDFSGKGWSSSMLGSGFDPRIPPALRHHHALAVDRSGRFIVAESFHHRPRLALLSPRYRIAPYFRSRTVVANPELAPARIVLNNTSDEELLVKIYNTHTDAKISELKVPARGSSTQTLERYSGVTIEESLLIDDGFGNVRGEAERYSVPAANVYHVVVWVNRVTSVYFDRTKNTGPIPDSESKSLVSMGVFPLPAGPELSDGLNIDVIRVVKEQKNPGAAGVFKR